MNIGSGFKKFLGAFGLIIVLGIIGNVISPKTDVKGIQEAVIPTVKNIVTPTAQPTTIPTIAPPLPTNTPTAKPTVHVRLTVTSTPFPDTMPAGASAVCGDGTYSFSQSRRGTCSTITE